MKSEIILHDHSVTFETNEPVVEKDGLVVNIVGGIGPRGTKGDKGDTPVKGVDYFTDEDIDEISDAAAGKVHVPTSVSELENDAGYLTEHQDISGKADKDEIPTRVSELENDMGYLTEHQDVSGKADKSEIPTRIGELENDVGYLTEHQDISNKADKSEIPVNVSELVNDAGYLTQHQDISNKAEKSEIPTRVSELENDTGYITGYTETDPTVPAWAKNAVKPAYTASEVGALPDNTHIPSTTGELENDAGFITADDLPVNVSELVNDAGYLTQHQDISGKADKSEIPVNVSELTNDAGYLTTETDPTVPAWAKAAQKPEYTAAEVGATTEQQVNEMIADAVPDVPVHDVQVGGISVLNNGVAEIPIASDSVAGVMKASDYNGVKIRKSDSQLLISPATNGDIKNSNQPYKPIIPSTQHLSAFYGLAKAAGHDEKNSALPAGQYTDEAKTAIQTMLDVPSKSDIPEVPVQDIQINKVSIVEDGTANIPIATSSALGVMKVGNGLYAQGGSVHINAAPSRVIQAGSSAYAPVTTSNQHESTFYGLAKAAGDTSQSVSSNTVGTYTDEAKAAIQNMLDVPSNTDLVQAISDVEEKIQHMYICSATEYNSETGVPTVANPDSKMFYLVPSAEGSPNLYIEWVYLNDTWERFGSATIDLSNYVQFSDYASADKAGVVKVDDNGTGITITPNGKIRITPAQLDQIKAGAYGFQPIQPGYQYASTFYGLAKAAGDTTQSQSSNAVGTYTQEAKAAIQTMLDVPAKADIPEVPIQDVQVNGTSVLQDGVANVPKANASSMGVVGIEGSVTGFSYGLGFYTDSSQLLVVKGALPTQIKTGTQGYKPIVPMTQHESVFYGLAKAAGHDEKDSAEPLGTYTSEAKTAIKNMLGIEEGLKVVRLI